MDDIPSFHTSVREFVRSEMKEQGLSLLEIARRTGINAGNLSRYMNGKCGLSMPHLDAVVHAVTKDIGDVAIVIDE